MNKKIFNFSLVLFLLFLSVSAIAGHRVDGDQTVTGNQTVTGSQGSSSAFIGSAAADTMEHVYFESNKMLDSNGVTKPVVAWTYQITANTAGSETVVYRQYGWDPYHAGTYGMTYSTAQYAAAPSGSETPVDGCIVIANRTGWDPLSKGSGGPYQAQFCGGTVWAAPGACIFQ